MRDTADRDDLRQRLRTARRALSEIERRDAAAAVAGGVAVWPLFGEAQRIAGYWACNGELDPTPLLEVAWTANKTVYLPVVVDTPFHALRFAPYRPGLPLRRNRFNIPEPDVAPSEWLAPEQLDLVLVPLVAFDEAGTRFGMGGGFYDRSFAFLGDSGYRGHRPLLLGLGYQFQKSAEPLRRQPWDVPLNAVATEAALQVFGPTNGMARG